MPCIHGSGRPNFRGEFALAIGQPSCPNPAANPASGRRKFISGCDVPGWLWHAGSLGFSLTRPALVPGGLLLGFVPSGRGRCGGAAENIPARKTAFARFCRLGHRLCGGRRRAHYLFPKEESPLIQFENVSKSYRNQADVVRNLSFEIPTGEIVVLIGPSGCGKTTCLKMINRLVDITSGRILIDGQDITQTDPIELRRGLGYVIQQTGLFPHMTVRENIEIIPTLQKRDVGEIRRRTRELMEMVGLPADDYLDRYPTQLSGGQLQRVGVARAFATDPDIILMDEPFSALDPITRAQLQEELFFLQQKLHKTIVFVTHDMDEAVKIADRICILHDGAIAQYDTPEAILKQPASDYVAQFVGRRRIWNNPEYIRARDIMMTEPVVAPADLPLFNTLELMRLRQVDRIFILDSGRKLLGVVRARDIQKCADKSAPNSALIVQPQAVASPDASLVELLERVRADKLNAIPILDGDGRLVGLVTTSSLVTAMSRQFIDYEEVGAV